MSETFNLLELPQYLQYEVLVSTPIKDFSSLCKTNKDILRLCSGNLTDEQKLLYGDNITERLYKERSEKWFDEEILNFRETNMSWKEFYLRITEINNEIQKRKSNNLNLSREFILPILLQEYVAQDKLFEIKLLYNTGQEIYPFIIKQAASLGYLDILQWISTLPEVIIDSDRSWSKQNLTGKLLINYKIANEAAKNGNINVLNWLKDYDILPTEEGIKNGIQSGKKEIVKWTIENNILPIGNLKSLIRLWGHLDTFNWMIKNGYMKESEML